MTRQRRGRRSGAAAVEFAAVAPLVFLFFFAAFEFARMNMLRHTVEMAAFEGARCGIVPGATAMEAWERANGILSVVGAREATINVTPDVIDLQTKEVTVRIQVPLDANAWVTPYLLRGMQIDRKFTLIREQLVRITPVLP
ncbi:MAG: pilus assembly protein [Planctomycetota bacterium]|nr:pilus assembly protein [Planctomycetota bacterium]